MPISLRTNLGSLGAQRALWASQQRVEKSYMRISTGRRINTASDDAAGMAVGSRLQSRVRSYAVAERNTMSAISMATTAEGALGEMSGIVVRMRELAVQAANGDLNTGDRSYLDTEFRELATEVDRLSSSTTFNGLDLLGGSATSVDFQVGIGTSSYDVISVSFGGVSMSSLGFRFDNLSGGTVVTVGNAGGSQNVTSVGVGGTATVSGNNNSNINVTGVIGDAEANGNNSSTINLSNVAGEVIVNGNVSGVVNVSNVAAGATVIINGTTGGAVVNVSDVAAGETVDFSGQVGGVHTYFGDADGSVFGIGGSDGDQARQVIPMLDDVLSEIGRTRATYGATINRLDVSYSNSQTLRTNLQAAESQIMDVDVAQEASTLARSQVLLNAGTSVLAQANRAPGLALQLLG